MNRMRSQVLSTDKQFGGIAGYLHYAGYRYWPASILPVLIGTTLPFWLRPPGFSFKWTGAIEFLIVTVSVHAGFSFLLARVQNKTPSWLGIRLTKYAIICFVIACFVGLHLNNKLILHPGVPSYIFIVYGLTALFVCALFILPPFNFYKRPGGEIILDTVSVADE